MLVDYHFHPNLSKYDYFAKRKCRQIWRQFSRNQLAVVVVTEHVFKNPLRAYQLLNAMRPPTASTVIFPGIEALTKEGVDVIVFSQDDALFSHQKLMVPKQLALLDMVRYIKQQPALTGSLAHPTLVSRSGSERQVGKATTVAAIRELGGVEVANACFRGFLAVMHRGNLEWIFKKKKRQFDLVMTLPKEYYDFPEVKLYTGGSDAHVVDEIGTGMNVNAAPLADRAVMYQAICSNRSTDFILKPFDVHPRLAVYKFYTVAREALVKAFRLYEGRLYQNDDAFMNYYSEAEKEAVIALRHRRDLILKPVLNFLTYFMVTPTVLNIVSLLLIADSALQVTQHDPWIATFYFAAYVLVNSLTGPLSRYQHKASEAGAIIHIIIYQLALLAAVLAAMALNWVDNWLGAVYLLLYLVMLWLIIALNKIGRPVRLVIRSKNIVLAAILLFVLTGINWLLPIIFLFSVYMVVMNIMMIGRLLLAVQAAEKTSTKSNPQSQT